MAANPPVAELGDLSIHAPLTDPTLLAHYDTATAPLDTHATSSQSPNLPRNVHTPMATLSPSPPASASSSVHGSSSTIVTAAPIPPAQDESLPQPALRQSQQDSQPQQPQQPEPPQLPQQQQQPQPPQQLPTPPTSRSVVRPHERTALLPEMPSAADFFPPPAAASSGGSKSKGSEKLMNALDTKSIRSAVSSNDSAPNSTSSSAHFVEAKMRFERLPQGGHRHHLSAKKRHFFLANQLGKFRDLLDSMKEPHGQQLQQPLLQPQQQLQPDLSPRSATPDHGHNNHHTSHIKAEQLQHPLSLLHEKKNHYMTKEPPSPVHSAKSQKVKEKHDFVLKYGELDQVIGKGAFGTVRLTSKRNSVTQEPLYAVKEFKVVHGESQKSYMRRVTSEFCIASTLKHLNVIQTLDLLQIHDDTYCEVMDYCGGGDLHSLIASANTLTEPESNCYFYQLMHGVGFLHANGVVHRDLKPENLLLTADGCLKIADFGNSEVFRMPWETKLRASTSIRGSGPFIAPEEFTEDAFDARKVDIWACGIIYLCMRLGRYNWHEASSGDPIWESFLYNREKLVEREAAHRERSSSSPVTPRQAPPSGPARSMSSATSSPSSSNATLASPPPSRQAQQQQQQKQQKSRPLTQSISGSKINIMAIEQAAHINLGLPMHIATVISDMLEPNPRKRAKATPVLESDWVKIIETCHPSEPTPDIPLDESDLGYSPSGTSASPTSKQTKGAAGTGSAPRVANSNRVGSKVMHLDTDMPGCKIVTEAKECQGQQQKQPQLVPVMEK